MADESSDIVLSDEEKLAMMQDDVKHANIVMPAMDLFKVHGTATDN